MNLAHITNHDEHKRRFIVLGEAGALVLVQRRAHDQWPDEWRSVDFHFATPPPEDLRAAWPHENCEFLEGATCWCDGGLLMAEMTYGPAFDRSEHEGWDALDDLYRTEMQPGISESTPEPTP